MKRTKQFLSLFLAFAILFTMLPTAGFAVETEPTEDTAIEEYTDILNEETISEAQMDTAEEEVIIDEQIPEQTDAPEEEIISDEQTPEQTEETPAPEEVTVQTAEEETVVSEPAMGAVVQSGKCGDNLTWTLNSDGTLSISGTGRMTEWDSSYSVPWYKYRNQVISVLIHQGVTSIGTFAFKQCTNLTSLTMPSSVTSIGYYAFTHCTSLTNISVATDNQYFCSASDVLFSKDKKTLVIYPAGKTGFYTIPTGTTMISGYAFDGCTSLTGVCIPDSVSNIGAGAFFQCTNLTSITIPSSLTSIEYSTFSGCTSLTNVTIADRVTDIGSSAFSGCTSLTNISIPSSVSSIGSSAFRSCTGLTSITLSKGVASIGDYAFKGCSSLTSISIPNSVISIDKNAFEDCTSLTDVTIQNGITSIVPGVFCGCISLSSITIPSSVISIEQGAFTRCNSLTSITIPGSVTRIDKYAFYNCARLSDIRGDSGSEAQRFAMENGYRFSSTNSSAALENATITIPDQTYTGQPLTPEPMVVLSGTTLKPDVDYVTTYINNINAGTATVTITGIGNYLGITTKSFTIAQADSVLKFANATVSKKTTDSAFTNTLTKTTDGTVTYSSSNTGVATVNSSSGQVTIKGAGTATITASAAAGKNYKAGSASYTLTISSVSISSCTITMSPTSFTYDNKAKQPTVTVKNGTTTLKNGADYTVTCSDNINAGKATVTITGKGCYVDTIKKTFTISKATPTLKFAKSSVSIDTSNRNYANKITKETDGIVTFTSSAPKVASINKSTGQITIKSLGTTTITASANEGKNYKVGKATYKLTIKAEGLGVSIHSKEEIQTFAYAHPVSNARETSFSTAPSLKAPYRIGKLSNKTMTAILNLTNQIRYIAGLNSNVTINQNYQELAMSGTLVNYLNDQMSHYPNRPAVLSGAKYDQLYEYGSTGCGSSNLGWGYRNLYHAMINGWMADDDAGNIDRVGHRRWVLNPNMAQTGFGVTGNFYAMYVFDWGGSGTQTKIAWPAHNIPIEFFEASYPWTLSIGEPVDMNTAKVKLVRKRDGKTWSFSKSSSNGYFNVNNRGYGQTGCIIFRPNGLNSISASDTFQVTVTLEGGARVINYSVNFFHLDLGSAPKNPKLSTPVLKSIQNVQDGVKISWSKVKGAAKYRVFRKSGSGSWAKVADTTALNYTDKNAKSGTKYTYTVRCMSADSKTYTSAYDTKGKTITYIATPVLSKVENVSGGVKVTWKKSAGAAKYRVFRKAGSAGWTKVADTTSTAYTDETAKTGTKYAYTVRCISKDGKSYTSAYNTTGKTTTYVAVPLLSGVKNSKTKTMTVSWKKDTAVTGYQIQYSVSNNFDSGNKTITVKGTSNVSKTITMLTRGKTYYVRIRSYKAVSGKNMFSAWSAAKSVGISK